MIFGVQFPGVAAPARTAPLAAGGAIVLRRRRDGESGGGTGAQRNRATAACRHGVAAFWAICLVIALLSAGVRDGWAALRLVVPESAGDGTAVLAVASCGTPVDRITFEWAGRGVAVPVEAAQGVWAAQVLLPVPLDAEPGMRPLLVKGERAGVVVATAAGDVRVFRAAYPVQKLTVEGRYVSPSRKALDRHEAERARVRAVLGMFTPMRSWGLPFVRPVQGGVSSEFGLRREFNGERRAPHRGVDLRAAEGDSVFACAAGRVVLAEDQYFSGNVVYVDHGFGVVSSYMHLSAFSVRPGDVVAAGDEVGKVGKTGRVTGPHLHFGLAVLGESIDPIPLLQGGER